MKTSTSLKSFRGSNSRYKRRQRCSFFDLEALESRILLSVTELTWTNVIGNGLWSDRRNWENPDGSQASVAPNSTDYSVLISQNAAITVDGDDTVNGITVYGDASATLTFDAPNRELDILPDNDQVGGDIFLDQTVGHQASLTLATNAANPAITVNTSYLAAIGDTSGSSALAVNAGITLNVANNVDTTHFQFNASISGTLTMPNAYFAGKAPDVSHQLSNSRRQRLAA